MSHFILYSVNFNQTKGKHLCSKSSLLRQKTIQQMRINKLKRMVKKMERVHDKFLSSESRCNGRF